LLTAIQLRPTIFNFGDNTVRVIEGSEGEPWFAANDVLDILGCGKSNRWNWLQRLLADEMGNSCIITPGGEQRVRTVSESGLYKLVMRSNKPEAREFQNWVTREVLPAIRKDGA
jgi:prophage antirepressor-like protein